VLEKEQLTKVVIYGTTKQTVNIEEREVIDGWSSPHFDRTVLS
jgi:hypothetical protein